MKWTRWAVAHAVGGGIGIGLALLFATGLSDLRLALVLGGIGVVYTAHAVSIARRAGRRRNNPQG